MQVLTDLRALRLWHWQNVLDLRAKARRLKGSLAKQADGQADTHLKAVQLLNDVVSGTAEDDATRLFKSKIPARGS